jgi:hypothetical protein
MMNKSSYQVTELGAIFDELPSNLQSQVVEKMTALDDSRKSERMNLVRKIKNGEGGNGKDMASYMNSYLNLGDGSDATCKALLDNVAKLVLSSDSPEEGLQKASLDLTGSASGNNPAGLMNQAYGTQFFLNAKAESNFFNDVDMFQMQAKTQKIDRFVRGNRFLFPTGYARDTDSNTELGRALKPDNYYGYTASKTEFAATKAQGVLRIPREDLLNNITGANLMPFLLGQAQTRQIVDDMSDQIINGDTALAGSDAASQLLRVKDGVLKLAGTSVAAGGRFTSSIAINAQQAIAPEHWRRMGNAKFYLPRKAELGYLRELGALATALGDTSKVNGGNFSVTGIPVVQEDFLPMASTNDGVGVLIDPKVVKLGIWDSLRIYSEYEPATDDYLFYVTTEYDFKVLEQQQIIKITGLAV